ncbi:hypothetical protein [Pyxidicoccus xibeiensis]|uniref:hypothetical protein n=1 Tax=Pyxidicoccus xibeiensis TaxID=2906759 RepID=UPI0020A80016|nr:hypothetical protein [Pyxidicoccus xibeiensis]MCP3135941.1 hypothetical protein [Pyxidicoccus xibeiensis]
MGLRDWQAALGQLVEARSSGRGVEGVLASLEERPLKDEERRWLREVVHTPGFALTSDVPRWWRDLRVQRSARLTLMALRGSQEEVLRDYLRAVPCFTLFFIAEGLAFLAYVARTVTLPHVKSLAELEHALWTLKLAAPAGEGGAPEGVPGLVLERHPAAACVPFQASPQDVLAAVLTGRALPVPGEPEHPVLVAPGVAGLWRPATCDEARAFEACDGVTPLDAAGALPGAPAEAVATLLAAGALRVARPPE